jgi:RNA 2',3'-cyclic 3'-phosphodiesterase
VRLFVAADLPVTVRRLLSALPHPARPGLRWTTPAQWHVTLRFLGEVDEPEAVAEALGVIPSTLESDRVEAVLGPASAWFARNWVLQIPISGVEALAGVVLEATSRWGPSEEPAFAGHVTLARFRGPGSPPANLAGMPLNARFDVPEVVLYRSSPRPGGSAYEALWRVPVPVSPEADV